MSDNLNERLEALHFRAVEREHEAWAIESNCMDALNAACGFAMDMGREVATLERRIQRLFEENARLEAQLDDNW
jgi:hypothetical protein